MGDRRPALHFVGFRGNEYLSALRVFGPPDIVHIGWDTWAKQAVVPGDMAVFARGTFDDKPSQYSVPDIREEYSLLLPRQASCMSHRLRCASDG